MSGTNRQLQLYFLGPYIFTLFKGTPSFKVDKTGFNVQRLQKLALVRSM
jgi:hypothetical protein